MLQRGGAVVIRMLVDVKQVTIGPLVTRTIAEGTLIYTDEYDICSRLEGWGYGHETVCHGAGEYARDDRRGRVLRGACEHAGRVLVAAAKLASSSPRNFAGEPAVVSGLLRVRSQREGAWEEPLGVVDQPFGRTTPESVMTLPQFRRKNFDVFRIPNYYVEEILCGRERR